MNHNQIPLNPPKDLPSPGGLPGAGREGIKPSPSPIKGGGGDGRGRDIFSFSSFAVNFIHYEKFTPPRRKPRDLSRG
jgi:hypothetical protein